ncbi:MAG: hypothetical protein LBC07_02935, partial [Elusimicrobiota bacterium]|nr:hypothetical protein [Elusimicrobiota bacterium]
IKYWYNGYTWDGKTAIYNPYSTLSAFEDLKFSNYWIQTGTPAFLNSLIRQKRYNEVIYRQTEPFNERQLLGVNMEKLAISTLLFQAGYLTIKEINDDDYVLSWPNAEVRQSFSDAILEFAKDSNRVEAQVKDIAKQIDTSIQELNAPLFSDAIGEVLKNVPFRLFQDREAVYHAALLLALWACCFDAWGEDPTCTGIIDIVWKVEDSLYVII